MQKLGPNQELWLQALESGKYKQGSGCLEDKYGRFCCLGVACVIQDIPTTTVENKCRSFLPDDAVEIYGFYSCYGKNISIETLRCDFMNDDKEMTFSEIAKCIRLHPEHYFREPK